MECACLDLSQTILSKLLQSFEEITAPQQAYDALQLCQRLRTQLKIFVAYFLCNPLHYSHAHGNKSRYSCYQVRPSGTVEANAINPQRVFLQLVVSCFTW
ncbi:hypothetical protein [Chroogloeocystis siderophila]|jgi:hypothetical protein|uniref:Uncharacterized protein n=1 Tax=Chroogloeocystis siderophila 5.2 s.c.1 TaxID=247279 RepID=A0A1U7HX38_9CHRO|nr:hypothetical protein [Chroogloeocystis siderophila]OKH28164.1 hypothetical protein NIES1031_06240 [Chroogloeocystis siderophila 5.2 s.c.1]